ERERDYYSTAVGKMQALFWGQRQKICRRAKKGCHLQFFSAGHCPGGGNRVYWSQPVKKRGCSYVDGTRGGHPGGADRAVHPGGDLDLEERRMEGRRLRRQLRLLPPALREPQREKRQLTPQPPPGKRRGFGVSGGAAGHSSPSRAA